MSRQPLIWAGGLAASVLAHGVLLGLLLMTIRPGPVPEQPPPETRLNVEAHRLERVAAQERAPEADPAREGAAEAAAVDAGAIPRGRARPATAPAEAAQATAATGQKLAAGAVRPETIVEPTLAATQVAAARVSAQNARPVEARPSGIAATPAAAPALSASQAAPTALAAATGPEHRAAPVAAEVRPAGVRPAPAARVQPAVASAADLIPATPAAMPAAPAAAPSQAATQQAPQARPLAPGRVQGARAEPAEPLAERMTAALAFQGGDGEVDPVSLAAFQSFVRPGEAGAGAQALRDGVAGLLSGVPCGRLQVGFDPETATLQVNGHVPETDMRAPVLAALRDRMGADIAVSDNILVLPRPQCGALTGIAGVGLPQSTDQITNPLLIGAGTQARVFSYVAGDPLSFDLTAPDYPAWIYVDYFDAGGNVLHLVPNDHVQLRRSLAQSALQIGAKSAEETGLRLLIGPPYGQEIAVAFAASEPLYDGLRPLTEPAEPYLDWLKERVAEARADNPGFKGEWVYFFVRTSEK